MEYWGKFFCWNCPALAQLPRGVVKSPSLEGFNRLVDVALGDIVERFDLALSEGFSSLK